MSRSYLSTDELKAVLRAAESEQQRRAFLVAYWHGLRATELCSLTGAQIADGYVDVQRLKGSQHTRQTYMKSVDRELDESAFLAELAATTDAKALVFPDLPNRFRFYYVFSKAAKKAGMPKHKRHPHCLKHSIGKHSMKATHRIDVVQQWLGHKSMSSTGAYLKTDDEEAGQIISTQLGGA